MDLMLELITNQRHGSFYVFEVSFLVAITHFTVYKNCENFYANVFLNWVTFKLSKSNS